MNAEDAAQDTFETMFERLPTLREPDVFPAWLYGVTRRTLARHRRRAWVRRWVPGLTVDSADPRQDPAADTERGQTVARVWAGLNALAIHHREVLVLSDLEDRPDSEVAEMLGIPRPTVKSRLRRAREALRAQLGDLAPSVLAEADLGET